MNPIHIEHLKEWVGREQHVVDPLNLFPARALAAAFDHAGVPDAGDILPPSWHWLYFLDTPSKSLTGTDGHMQKGSFLPPVPLPRRMWAAGSVSISRALRLGMPAEKISTIQSVDLKSGKSGVLVFVTVHHELFQEAQLCVAEDQTLVYRDIPTVPGGAVEGELASTDANWSQLFHPDPILLFRFSALTYNSHRIHYDRDYATREELYPGLVVHAPLLVTLLLNLALHESPKTAISSFQFRAVRPTFDIDTVHLRGRAEGQAVSLWSADHQNYVGMKVSAVFGDHS